MNFFSAETVPGDGGTAVAFSLGGATAILRLQREYGRIAPGRKVVLGIRPEHIVRDIEDLRRVKRGIATPTAPVEVVEPTGSETIVVLRFGEREVTARFDPDSAPRLGEKVALGIDMAHTCLFDPESERLI